MAPARSWEKERHSASGYWSEKKLETRVMGPGLNPGGPPPPVKRDSKEERGGRAMVGGRGGADSTLEAPWVSAIGSNFLSLEKKRSLLFLSPISIFWQQNLSQFPKQ